MDTSTAYKLSSASWWHIQYKGLSCSISKCGKAKRWVHVRLGFSVNSVFKIMVILIRRLYIQIPRVLDNKVWIQENKTKHCILF